MKGLLRVLTVATLVGLLAACAAPAATGPRITIQDPWARPGAMGMGMEHGHGMSHGGGSTSAVYFVAINDGDQPDVLIGAASDVAEKVEIHETKMEGDVAKMQPVPRVEIPARGRVEFRPRGLHIMLIGLKRDLKVGDTFNLTLRFEKSGEIPISVTVKEMP
ncbi:copper chaperone PCu(A)C [Thermoflexus sp.]|uniref:copper chaperone PCu(A)C n=1 Tax=Thermoflexus sp. TaxID=1969742 RepID=UPI0025E724FA|nr:copper chaperone PCu(A)C [Thermoflexus sp.]MDW8180310.1 copper chaperone PCu(A)C [Anaerolineae bacterium]MCS6962917.1 copper chaperone PCu(A)C [Thermoflexus sp.]MCS7350859.1 copper chaperone PCu(A)C [Thermoflexus sp.]MCX7690249.1 copper chaperone PCu(A)C [Thermoflexus sp.]MDW8186190.1 copper chaperone PCu(A)C [Anaerolineae bacterium]